MNPADSEQNKFEQLSPLLELMYLMVSDMKKYLKVYAEDMKMDTLPEYKEVSDSLQNLKVTLDKIYGIEAPVKEVRPPKMDFPGPKPTLESQPQIQQPQVPHQTPVESKPDISAMKDAWSQVSQQTQTPARPQTTGAHYNPHIEHSVHQQAHMNHNVAAGMSVPTPLATEHMLPAQEPMPAIEAPGSDYTPIGQQFETQSPVAEPAPQQAPAQSNEIDSILAELRKLQSNNRSGN